MNLSFFFLSRTVLTVEYPVVRSALLVNFQALGTIYIPGLVDVHKRRPSPSRSP